MDWSSYAYDTGEPEDFDGLCQHAIPLVAVCDQCDEDSEEIAVDTLIYETEEYIDQKEIEIVLPAQVVADLWARLNNDERLAIIVRGPFIVGLGAEREEDGV